MIKAWTNLVDLLRRYIYATDSRGIAIVLFNFTKETYERASDIARNDFDPPMFGLFKVRRISVRGAGLTPRR